jgi:F-type H+-transporting ATPase subunit delta
MPTSGVARRYARAVFEIAQEDHDLDGWLRDLRTIRDVFRDPTLSAFLESPAVSTDQKLKLLESSTGTLGVKQRSFVALLIENRRAAIIESIVETYEGMLDEARGVVHARVTTAVPLNAEMTAAVAARLKGIVRRDVILATSVDPSIIGGFVARVGDQLIDASVVGRLNALRESLMA